MPRNRSATAALLGATIAVVAGLAVLAQPSNTNQAGGADQGPDAGPPGVPVIQVPPDTASPPTNAAAAHAKSAATNSVASNALAAQKPTTPPPPAAIPVRSPAAIIQALDKVTTETMRFAAPVGQRVRYKNLVFTVKACETTNLGQASPQASAYVVIDSAPLPSPGVTPTAPKEVFHGWMFANSPELNPFQHPVYDAWLIACMASAPKA